METHLLGGIQMTSNNAQFGCNSFTDPASIVNGLPVNADTINARLEALYQNDLYLKQVLDYYEMPSGLIRCVEVDPGVLKGQPVYYSDVSGRYELAFYSETGGVLDTNAQAWGIVVKKETSDTALILIDGIYPVDLTASLGTANHSGKLFLGDTPGSLTATPSSADTPVFVLSGSGDGSVLFRPWTGENLGTISQWKHSLVCEAAGAGAITDCVGAITSANASLPGWLPADDASFGGNAPAGAHFGYNIAADANLLAKWPLKYPDSAHLDFDRGCHIAIGGTSIPMGANGLAIIDENGIWWMNDCAQDLPWDPVPGSPSNDDCPRTLAKRLTLHMAAPAGAEIAGSGSGSGVSLVSTHPAFRFVKENTDTLASVGALDLSFTPANLLGVNTDYSGLALKSVNGSVIDRGPIVTSLKPGNGISLTSDSAYDTDRYFHEIEISAELAGSRELLPGTTALSKATEERTLGSLGIGLPARRLSSLTSMFQVPLDLTGPVTVSFRMWTMANYATGAGSGAAEQLDVSVKVLTPPSPSSNLSAITDTALTIPASAISNNIVEEQISNTFDVDPGSLLYITIERPSRSLDYMVEVLKHYVYVESTSDSGGGVVPTTTTASPTACGCFTDCDCA